MGVGEARNRTRRAVERTVPFGLICFSVVTVWYALHGHAPHDVASHRTRARWYTTKTEPSYDDMTVKLRRVIIAARFRSPCPELATPQETRPSSRPGPPPAHDPQNLRNTRDEPVGQNSDRRGPQVVRVDPSRVALFGAGSPVAQNAPVIRRR